MISLEIAGPRTRQSRLNFGGNVGIGVGHGLSAGTQGLEHLAILLPLVGLRSCCYIKMH